MHTLTTVLQMKKLFLIGVLIFNQLPGIGQIKAVKMELTDIIKVHAWISELTSGNVIWLEVPRGEVFATQYRIAIGISDIYHTLIVEKILYGNEGCCKQVD